MERQTIKLKSAEASAVPPTRTGQPAVAAPSFLGRRRPSEAEPMDQRPVVAQVPRTAPS